MDLSKMSAFNHPEDIELPEWEKFEDKNEPQSQREEAMEEASMYFEDEDDEDEPGFLALEKWMDMTEMVEIDLGREEDRNGTDGVEIGQGSGLQAAPTAGAAAAALQQESQFRPEIEVDTARGPILTFGIIIVGVAILAMLGLILVYILKCYE